MTWARWSVRETVGPELWQAPWGETGAAMDAGIRLRERGVHQRSLSRKDRMLAQLNEEYFLVTVTVTAVEDGGRCK